MTSHSAPPTPAGSAAAVAAATDPPPSARSAGGVLAHGAALLLFLGFLRLEKALVLDLRLGVLGWAVLFLPEIVFIVLVTGVWLLLALSPRRGLRLAGRLGLPFVALVYLLALADHLFFLHTGTRLRLELASYAFANLRMLRGLLSWGADAVLVARALLAILFVTLAFRIGRLRVPAPRRRTVAACVAAAAVAGLLPLPGLPVAAAGVERSALPELVSGIRYSLGGFGYRGLDLVPPDELYQPPAAIGRTGDAPNLILLVLESTGAGVTPPYAPAARELAPELAALAERSVVFDPVYASVTHTSKALVGILCGFFPRLEMPITESQDGGLPLACAPKLLGDQGYRTLFLQTATAKFENRPGLIRNLGFGAAGFRETLDRGRGYAWTGYFGMDELAMVEPVVHWTAEGGEQPYFLTVLTITPHHPYQVPGRPLAGGHRARYEDALAFQDRFVDTLLAALEDAGALEDTVLIVVGDHGEAFGEHGRLQHDAVPYEEVVRVPLLLSGPEERIGPPRTVGGLRHQVDLLPTLLELAGIEWRGVVPGASLLGSPGHERVFSSCWYANFCLGMREADRKVVYHFGRRPTEVFDLSADPHERNDLAPALPEAEVEAAERRMLSFQFSIGAFWDRHPAPEGEPLWWAELGS